MTETMNTKQTTTDKIINDAYIEGFQDAGGGDGINFNHTNKFKRQLNDEVQKKVDKANSLLDRVFKSFDDVDHFVSSTFVNFMNGSNEADDTSIEQANLYEEVETHLSNLKEEE